MKKKKSPIFHDCGCIPKINAELAATEHGNNTRVDQCTRCDVQTGETVQSVMIATAKLDSRNKKKAITLFPTFCPFCGEKMRVDT